MKKACQCKHVSLIESGPFSIQSISDRNLALSKKFNDNNLVLSNVDKSDPKQQWIMCSHPDNKFIKLRNIASNRYITTATHHIWITDAQDIWKHNRTYNYLVGEEDSDEQKWYLGPNNTIKHLNDGRCISINSNNVKNQEQCNTQIGYSKCQDRCWYFELI